jgi:hypothetical protein
MPNEMKTTPNIALQDIVAAAAEGAIRAIGARELGAAELVKSGFMIDVHVRAGGIPPAQFLDARLLPARTE